MEKGTKLQGMLYPVKDLSGIDTMYFQGDYHILDNGVIEIEKELVTATYFNSFSIEKWSKYTHLENLSFQCLIKGHFRLIIYNQYRSGYDFVEKIISAQEYDCREFTAIAVDLTECIGSRGIMYYKIVPYCKGTQLKEAYYETKNELASKRFGIVICTYKREKYIQRFLKQLSVCPFKDMFEVFLSDNGKTLENSTLPNVHIVQNPNYGGASGFARGMYSNNLLVKI